MWSLSRSITSASLTGPRQLQPTQPNTFFFLFLSWQLGFFRRRYREIIEAEKNRKDSDESWDWVEKNHWGLQCGGPRGANENRDWVRKDPMARGLAAQLPRWHPALQSSICGIEDYSPDFWRPNFFFFPRLGGGSRKQASEVTVGLPVEGTPIQQSGAVEWHPHPHWLWRRHEYRWTLKPSGLCHIANLFLYVHFKPCWEGGVFEGHYKHTVSAECFPKSTDMW